MRYRVCAAMRWRRFSWIIEQHPGLGHRVDRFLHHGVGLDGNAPALVDAERRQVHLALQALLDPDVVLRELGFGELNPCSSRKSCNSARIFSSGTQPLGSLASRLPK